MKNLKTLKPGFLKAGSTMRLISKNMPVFYFLFSIGMVYITLALMTEKRVRNIEFLKKDLKELRWEYMSLKSELMYSSTYSQVAKDAFGEDSGKLEHMPKRILVGYRP